LVEAFANNDERSQLGMTNDDTTVSSIASTFVMGILFSIFV